MSLPLYAVDRTRTPDEASELVGDFVEDDETARVLDRPGIYFDSETGDPVCAYDAYPGDVARLRRAAVGIHWDRTYRGSTGIKNVSRTFGMAPRKPMLQRESCRPASLFHEQPEIHAELETSATLLAKWVSTNLPEIAAEDRKTVEPVLPEWRIGEESIWTSGVVNLSSQLPYHRDGANFSSWSAMPILRRGTRGGRLHLPEYDASIACRDGMVAYFPGWRLVHGVTPIRKVADDGYRITIVYYSLQGMKDCHTFAVETARGRRIRAERESHMLRDSEFDPGDYLDNDGLPG